MNPSSISSSTLPTAASNTNKTNKRSHCVKKKIAPRLRPRGTASLLTKSTTPDNTNIDTNTINPSYNITSTSTAPSETPISSSSNTVDQPAEPFSVTISSTRESEEVTSPSSPLAPSLLAPSSSTIMSVVAGRKRSRLRTISSSSDQNNIEEEVRESNKKVRKKFDRLKPPDRSIMTMQDLIHHNPSSNPMNTTEKTSASLSSVQSDLDKSNDPSSQSGKEGEGEDEGMLVPKLKIAADGTIEIDETSMVVEVTHKPFENLSTTVTEDNETVTSTSFRFRHKIKKWTSEETNHFYKALSQVGTDFTMMTLILPNRTRKELKNKFKKEEKSNPVRISAALERLFNK